jgi:hypothetical protein
MQKIVKCRSCDSNKLINLFSLGKIPYSGIFPKKNQKVEYGNLSLVLCKKCKLVQLDRNFNPKKMYGHNYGYRTGLNSDMVRHMGNKANRLKKYLKHKSAVILDIGSNDGTFLGFFDSHKYKLIGIDPTIKKFKKFYKKKIITISDFFTDKIFLHKCKKKADLITSHSMLYDLQRPKEFIKNIYDSLNEHGVWHTEQSYLKSMIKRKSYDTICHEHLEYYSLKSLKYLFDEVGFKIIEIDFNNINGGSVAITLAKKKSTIYKEKTKKILKILKEERKEKLYDIKTYQKFYHLIRKQSKELFDFLSKLKNNNKLVLGYGASTKGNIILNFSKINSNLIPYIAEVNSFKFNKFAPGKNIKIISEAKARKIQPDYFLVLPWHFKNFIIEKEKNIYKDKSKKPKLIFPLPKLNIV